MLSRLRALRSAIVRLGIAEESYAQKIAAIQEYIRSGDTYQVNFTDTLHFDFSGSPEAMFAALSDSSAGAVQRVPSRRELATSCRFRRSCSFA